MNFADRASEFALPGRARRNATFARRFRRSVALQERHNLVAGDFRFVRRAHLLDGVRNAPQHRPFNALANPFEKIKIHCFQENYGKEVYGLFNTFALKYENIQGVVFCTAWRHGDKIHPVGRNCGKTLKALFNEKKMTQSQKLACPVIRDDAGVLAVMGFPADERTKAESGDKILRLVIEKY